MPIINFLLLLQNCFVVWSFFKYSNHKYFYNFLIWKTHTTCKEYLENWFYRVLYTEEQNQRRVIKWLKLLCQDQNVSKFGLTLPISTTPHKVALSQPSCHITLGYSSAYIWFFWWLLVAKLASKYVFLEIINFFDISFPI